MIGIGAWTNMMPHTVTIAPYVGNNASGYDTPAAYGTPVSYKARVTTKNVLMTNPSGRQVLARGVAYVATTTVPGLKDKITLPTGFTPTSPVIVEVRPRYSESQLHHCEVWF